MNSRSRFPERALCGLAASSGLLSILFVAMALDAWPRIDSLAWFNGLLNIVVAEINLRNGLRFRCRRLWSEKGLCVGCGYDLRATPDRCPECGTTSATSG